MTEEIKKNNNVEENILVALSRIKLKLLFSVIAGAFLLFTMSDWTIGACVFILSFVLIAYGIFKFGGKNIENVLLIRAKCIEKRRIGYRKQYLEYMFEDENQNTFVIKTSQKEKFRKGMRYELCFAKNKAGAHSEINNPNLVYCSQSIKYISTNKDLKVR